MKVLEKLREYLQKSIEEIAEEQVAWRYDYVGREEERPSHLIDTVYISKMLEDFDPGAEYCLEHHHDCPNLDNFYDVECSECYGRCNLEDWYGPEATCPYKISRRAIYKKGVIELLSQEVD